MNRGGNNGSFLSNKDGKKYSYIDYGEFAIMAFCLFILYNTVILATVPFGMNIAVGRLTVAAGALLVTAWFSAKDIYEEEINFFFRIAFLGMLIFNVGGATMDSIKSEATSFSYNANIPTIVPEGSNDKGSGTLSKCGNNADCWMNEAVNTYHLQITGEVDAQGKKWCKTAEAKQTNQGMLHCLTGKTFTKGAWSKQKPN